MRAEGHRVTWALHIGERKQVTLQVMVYFPYIVCVGLSSIPDVLSDGCVSSRDMRFVPQNRFCPDGGISYAAVFHFGFRGTVWVRFTAWNSFPFR